MSINTSNLVTTANGLAELARVQGLNARLFGDHREISLQMLFPYIAISKKTVEEVEASTSSTDEAIRVEAAWAHVDVCQVQSYSREEVTYRDFTIGALMEIKNNVENARTVILFCKTRIVDARSSSRKSSDGNRTAEDILNSEYGYTVNQLPFAYTELLDSDGNVNTDGIAIGAAKFGRTRHRMLFNYIIDNNSGIADNITVDDNVYPYSDGYLSKRAFEEGLKRYEAAVAEYQAEYEKFANGSRLYYDNVEEALKWANSRHKFLLKKSLRGNGWLTDSLQYAISGAWPLWPSSALSSSGDEYDGYTAAKYGTLMDSVRGLESCNWARAVDFWSLDYRKIEFSSQEGSSIETRTVYFQTMPFQITPLSTFTGISDTVCRTVMYGYNSLRGRIEFFTNETGNLTTKVTRHFEVKFKSPTMLLMPNKPILGKVSYNSQTKTVTAHLLIQLIFVTRDDQEGKTYVKDGYRFYKMELPESFENNILSPIKTYKGNQKGEILDTMTTIGRCLPTLVENFPGGYLIEERSEDELSTTLHFVKKEFDSEKTETYNFDGEISTNYIQNIKDGVAYFDKIETGEGLYPIKSITFNKGDLITSTNDIVENLTELSSRLVGVYSVKSAKIYVWDYATLQDESASGLGEGYVYALCIVDGMTYEYQKSYQSFEQSKLISMEPVDYYIDSENHIDIRWNIHFLLNTFYTSFLYPLWSFPSTLEMHRAIMDIDGNNNIQFGNIISRF